MLRNGLCTEQTEVRPGPALGGCRALVNRVGTRHLSPVAAKGLNEHPPIPVTSDNALSAITSRHDMVHRTLKLDPELSRHPFNSLIYRQSVRIC